MPFRYEKPLKGACVKCGGESHWQELVRAFGGYSWYENYCDSCWREHHGNPTRKWGDDGRHIPACVEQ